MSDIIENYKKIAEFDKKVGDFKKLLFHIHTPASHDYHFKSGWTNSQYKKLGEDEFYNTYIKDLFPPNVSETISSVELTDEWSIYENKKDLYTYASIAQRLIEQEYELVVVSDHNTTKGIRKLQLAIDNLPKREHCNIVHGVEISCADMLHVVVMFEEIQLTRVNEWIKEHLISEELGVMKSSHDVIEHFQNNGCFAYIAHINTSQLFDKYNSYSGGYKQALLGKDISKFIGVNLISVKEKYSKKLDQVRRMKRNFIIDCDAHCNEDIPEKSMWVKAANNTTTAFFEALQEFDITVRYEEPVEPQIFIKGLKICTGENNYLTGKNKNTGYLVQFSPSLNSFIGGRGTGKSTSLDILNFILTQDFKDKEQLYFFSLHGRMFLLIEFNKEEYMIHVDLPYESSAIDLIAKLTDHDPEKYREEISINKNKVKKTILKKYLFVYKIEKDRENKLEAKKQRKKKTLLTKFYDERYSINSLVNSANNNEFGQFIYELLFKDKHLEFLSKKVGFRTEKGLLEFFEKKASNILEERKSSINSVIEEYNEKQKNVMKITYNQKQFEEFTLPSKFSVEKTELNRKYDMTKDETQSYVQYIIHKHGLSVFLELCINKEKFSQMSELPNFVRNGRKPDYDKKTVTTENSENIVLEIMDNFLKENSIEKIQNFYKEKFDKLEEYSIEFNVNAYEGSEQKKVFKDIKKLSLGQKVVTILNLILSYGEYVDNLKPIVIDQPEDNLDSRYIYKNLVERLRGLKENRQIIIATHNSTIVTNSLSEKVIVMTSNGEHGWIKKEGYTTDKSIKKEILNVLEGGKNSFNHRRKIFSNIFG